MATFKYIGYQTLFKIPSFVVSRRKKLLQVWNSGGVSQNHRDVTLVLGGGGVCGMVCGFIRHLHLTFYENQAQMEYFEQQMTEICVLSVITTAESEAANASHYTLSSIYWL